MKECENRRLPSWREGAECCIVVVVVLLCCVGDEAADRRRATAAHEMAQRMVMTRKGVAGTKEHKAVRGYYKGLEGGRK